MQQLQYERTIPLVVTEKTIAELECSVFVDFDCNDVPYISEIWVEPITGKGLLCLERSKGSPERQSLFKTLHPSAWSAVADDVKDDLLEAAE